MKDVPKFKVYGGEWYKVYRNLASDVQDFASTLIPVLDELGVDSHQVLLTAMTRYLEVYPGSLPDTIWWEVMGYEIVNISEELHEQGEISYSLTLEKDAGVIADIIRRIRDARMPAEEGSDIENLAAIMLSATREHLGVI